MRSQSSSTYCIGKMLPGSLSCTHRSPCSWHCGLSAADELWFNGIFKDFFPGKDPETITPGEFYKAAMGWSRQFSEDPGLREFGSYVPVLHHFEYSGSRRCVRRLKRQADGRFSDDDLARILKNGTIPEGFLDEFAAHESRNLLVDLGCYAPNHG